jgi:hypothetical protein
LTAPREELSETPADSLSVHGENTKGNGLSRIVVTALPAPVDVPVEEAWLHPVLPDSALVSVAKGDIRLARIMVSEGLLPELDAARRERAQAC